MVGALNESKRLCQYSCLFFIHLSYLLYGVFIYENKYREDYATDE